MGDAGLSKWQNMEGWMYWFARFGYAPLLAPVIGSLEFIGAGLLLIPRLASYSALMLAVIMVVALEAVLTMAKSGSLQHIVLLHLSRHCNDPQLLQQLYAKQAPHLLGRLTISNQYAATPMLHVTGQAGSADHPERAGRQLNFLETRQK